MALSTTAERGKDTAGHQVLRADAYIAVDLKAEFKAALEKAKDHGSIWGMAIRSFKEDIDIKSDEEIIDLVLQLKSQIRDNKDAMREILGTRFKNYINNLKV